MAAPEEGPVARRARFKIALKQMRGDFNTAPFMRKIPAWSDARGKRDYEAMHKIEKRILPMLDGWRAVKRRPSLEYLVRPLSTNNGWNVFRLMFPAYQPKLTDLQLFPGQPNYDLAFARGVLDTDPSILLEQYVHIDTDENYQPIESVLLTELLWSDAMEAVLLLLEYPESAKYINAPDQDGIHRPLYVFAIMAQDTEHKHLIMPVARALINRGADPNMANNVDTTNDMYLVPSDTSEVDEVTEYLKSMEGLVYIGGEWRPHTDVRLPPRYRAATRALMLLGKT